MNVDTKHPLLQNFLSDKSLGKHSLKNDLGQSIASPEQKLLDMGLPQENSKNQSKKKSDKEKKLTAKSQAEIEKEKMPNSEKKIIERDPMKLLGIF